MASGSIPCTFENLYPKYANVENLVPANRKSARGNIEAAGGELYDPWFDEAEKRILRDLRKFQVPIMLTDFLNLADLSQLKALKTLELLFRTNFKEGEDKFKIEADRYAAEYTDELETIPVITRDGANYSLGGGVVRRT